MKDSRRYDIDWLRVIAIGLLMVYHVGIAFQPWAVFIQFIQNSQPLEKLWVQLSVLNVWRIPLLFFVSGMGVSFALRRRTLKALLVERIRRILVPLIFGSLAIVPLHVLLWQRYYSQDISYTPSLGHLWFLANIFSYVLLLLPVFYWFNKHQKVIEEWSKKWTSFPASLLLLALPFMAETLLVNPATYSLYAFTWHGFWLGLLAFLFGFYAVCSGVTFWKTLVKQKYLYTALAILLSFLRLKFMNTFPKWLIPIETVCWILALLAWSFIYLNRPGKTLRYLSQAAYPVYILHMFFQFLGSAFIFPLQIPIVIKFIMVLIITIGGSLGFYHFVLLKIKFLQPFFGMKKRKHNEYVNLM